MEYTKNGEYQGTTFKNGSIGWEDEQMQNYTVLVVDVTLAGVSGFKFKYDVIAKTSVLISPPLYNPEVGGKGTYCITQFILSIPEVTGTPIVANACCHYGPR